VGGRCWQRCRWAAVSCAPSDVAFLCREGAVRSMTVRRAFPLHSRLRGVHIAFAVVVIKSTHFLPTPSAAPRYFCNIKSTPLASAHRQGFYFNAAIGQMQATNTDQPAGPTENPTIQPSIVQTSTVPLTKTNAILTFQTITSRLGIVNVITLLINED